MMNEDFIFRVLIALGLAVIGISGFWLINRLILLRAGQQAFSLAGFQPGRPAVLYFSTSTCLPCQTMQSPALRIVKDRLGEEAWQLIQIDAVEHPEIAQKWGVMSVPTTFILDAEGKPRQINHGIVLADQLIKQIKSVKDN